MRLLIISIATFSILFPSMISAQGKSLNIIYTGSLQGELEPCGCSPKSDFGGLSRLSRFLLDNKKGLSPYILIDAGNFSAPDTPQGRLKADAMLAAFSAMRYDAVAFLNNEKAYPSDFFEDLVLKHKTPYVSDAYPCRQSRTFTQDDSVIHVSADATDIQPGSLNILLTDMSLADLQGLSEWDIIISSSGEKKAEPLSNGNTIILSAYPRGEKIGILKLNINGKGKIIDFNHSWQPLGNEIGEDRVVKKILDNYDQRVAKLLRESRPPAAGKSYAGVKKCAECHELFVESWSKTRHARAFASLQRVGKDSDPECIICHSVGFGEEGGFYTFESTPELANVQCEECHGLIPAHIEDFSVRTRQITEKVCLKCHTQENSPDFDYPVYLEKIRH